MSNVKSSGKAIIVTAFVTLSLAFPLPSALAAISSNSSISTGYVSYQVQQGDFLWLIGNKFNVTADSIMSLNGLTSTTIYPGQTLKIPSLNNNGGDSSKGISYTVQKGDTLYLLGQRFGVSIEQIVKESGLQSTNLNIGQQLFIPSTSTLPATPPTTSLQTYTVQSGDSLYLIAKKFGVDVAELQKENGLNSSMLLVGQVLNIPQSASGSTGSSDTSGVIPPLNQIDFTKPLPKIGQWGNVSEKLTMYLVKPGDNLWLIAKNYSTTTDAIKVTNHLHTDLLQLNQPLFIPQNSTQPVNMPAPTGITKEGFGELMDWQYASWILDTANLATIKDVFTGKSFQIKRYGGGNHCDSEPLTASDAAVMKDICGEWSWNPRAVLVTVGDKTLAASMTGMPHSFDSIPDNNFAGHFDLYFLNSTSHNNNSLNEGHQKMILKAAGY